MHPRPEDVWKVAERFRDLIAKHGDVEVSPPLTVAKFENGKPCGCHAGMYALAVKGDTGLEIAFTDGEMMMAEDLGFEDDDGWCRSERLVNWAIEHPELWGNRDGRNMFGGCAQHAFGKFGEPLWMSDVAEHWEGVAKRVEERDE